MTAATEHPRLDLFRPMRTVDGAPARFVGVIRDPVSPLVVAVQYGDSEAVQNFTADGFFWPDRRPCQHNIVNVEGK